MTVYIVQVRQGRYDDVSDFIGGTFSSKALADHYKHKLECVFKKCYDFYKEKFDVIDDIYENMDDELKTNEMAAEWCHFYHKKEKFESPYCHIVKSELKGMKKGD